MEAQLREEGALMVMQALNEINPELAEQVGQCVARFSWFRVLK